MHDKAKNIQIGIFATLFVIATVASIVLFIKYKETNEVLAITEQELMSNTANVAAINAEATKVENTTTEKLVEKNVEVAKIMDFDRSKPKKTVENVVYGDINQIGMSNSFGTAKIDPSGNVFIGISKYIDREVFRNS